eukprot:CAMPEP_0180321282 /NCGR_PEP_ID=MMETSP0988-20121125/36054_1 /TAXON_ID=697907 /ORGANISM="non described non described, Strain CCMP2293" /LENGTH=35 /DNA_ID= /DNA_START= /DNA_END= /DNA_ORIENTATION=
MSPSRSFSASDRDTITTGMHTFSTAACPAGSPGPN